MRIIVNWIQPNSDNLLGASMLNTGVLHTRNSQKESTSLIRHHFHSHQVSVRVTCLTGKIGFVLHQNAEYLGSSIRRGVKTVARTPPCNIKLMHTLFIHCNAGCDPQLPKLSADVITDNLSDWRLKLYWFVIIGSPKCKVLGKTTWRGKRRWENPTSCHA